MNWSKKDLLYISLALVFNIFVVILIYPKLAYIGTDGAVYATLGRNIIEGRGLTLYGQPHTIFSPLLPFFIGISFKIFNNLELAAHFATIFFGIVSVPLVYVVSGILVNRKVAMIALLFYSFSGFLLYHYAYLPSAQIPCIFFLLVIFYLLLRISQKNKFKFKIILSVVAGVIVGLSYLARPEYCILILPIVIFIYFVNKKDFTFLRILFIQSVFIVGFLMVSTPYFIFLKNNLGYWTISGRGSELILQNVGENLESMQYSDDNINKGMFEPPKVEDNLKGDLRGNIYFFVKRYIKNILNIEIAFLKYWGFLGMFFIVYGLRNFLLQKRFDVLAIYIIMLTPLLAIALAQTEAKSSFLIQFFYLFILLMAVGFCNFLSDFKKYYKLSKLKFFIFYFILIFSLCLYLIHPLVMRFVFAPESNNPREFKEMGLWMKENIEGIEEETILARKPDVSFYSGANWLMILNDLTASELTDIMRNNGYKYVVIDSRFLVSEDVGLFNLLSSDNGVKDLRMLKEFDFYNNKVLLYILNK